MRRLSALLPLLAFLFLTPAANAQTTNGLCVWALVNGIATCSNVTAGNPLPVTASVSVGAFLPSLVYNTCTATGSSCSSTAIPTNTGSVVLFNSGTTTVSCTLASGAATALASELQIPASSWLGLATTGYDHYACIDQSGSASNVVVASGGTGLPAGAGGGGSGGGGGAVTVADGADVALGAVADSAWSSGNGTVVGILKGIYAAATNGTGATAASVPTSAIYMGVNVGGNLVGFAPGTAGTASTQVTTVQGIASMTPLFTQPKLATSGGYTTYFLQPAASDNHTNVKNGAGQVYWVLAENNSATVNYLRFYDAASGFNGCNSATGLITQIQIPASTSVGGVNIPLPYGIPFSTGISICVTSGYATNDTTNATASAMSLTIGYN